MGCSRIRNTQDFAGRENFAPEPSKGRKASTVSLKLSVLRSFFEYLRAYGHVALNPASTRLVPPPPVAEGLAGRALVSKEARYPFAGPDRSKADGARDYAIILIMARMSLRVGEVASLKTSSITWSHGRSIIKFKVKGEGNGRCRFRRM